MLTLMTYRRRTARKKSRWILGLFAFGVLLLASVVFALPPIIRSQAETRLSALLHRPVHIGQVSLNPFNVSATVENFEIREPGGRGVFVSWDRLYVSFELISFFRHKWKFTAIELNGPHLRVAVNPDGSLNFSDLLALGSAPAPAHAPPAEPMRPVVITRLAVTGAQLDFSDQSRSQRFTTTLGPVGFAVQDLHTAGGDQAPYHFEAVTESGEKLSWHGWVKADPFRSGGELTLSGLILKKYAPYYAEKVGVDIADGRLSVTGRYAVSFDNAARMLRLLDGSLKLRNLQLVDRATGETVFSLPAADVTGASADGLTLKASIEKVDLQGGHMLVRREKDGSLNLLRLLPPSASAAAPAAPAPPAGPAVAVSAGEVWLRGWTIDVTDLAAPRPAQLGLADLGVRLQNVSLAPGTPMPLEVALRWQPRGTIRGIGTVSLQPVQADLRLKVDGLSLLPLSPYLENFARIRLADGTVTVDGHATAALPAGGAPAANFDGQVWLERLSILDQVHVDELAGFSDLILSGLKVSTSPRLSVALEDVNLNGPYGRAVMDRDRNLNLLSVLPEKKAEPAAATAPASAAPPAAPAGPGPLIEVGRLVINGGEFSLTDQSISPQVRLAVTGFGGTLSGLSSDNPGRGEVDLQANVGGSGPLSIKGRLDPLGRDIAVDAKVGLQGFDLLPFSPYSGKYAGYELARGKLFLDVSAKVAERKIDMANVVTLDQFTFGRATDSPDATKLPVRFGVALLKDLDGKIVLDVPVQGSLDDPEFKIGRVVWRVIGNLLVKAAASPFTLLGSMFGGGGDELSYQDFGPGESTLGADGLKKLGTLTKALTARPGLNLEIEGGYDAGADTPVLKQTKLADTIRRTIWEQRHARDPNIPPPDQLDISPADYHVTLKLLFDRKFPPGTEFGTPLPPPPFVPPPAPPAGNLLRRVVDFVTLKGPRERGAYRVAQQKAQADYSRQLKTVVDAGLPDEQMSAHLAESMVVTPDDLRGLAEARARRVRDYLVNEGHISADRLFLTQPTAPAADEAASTGKGARVFLKLE